MDWKLALQIVGVALGLLYLWLEYKANIWLWVVGLIMPIVHGTLYFRSGLYADFAMQLYYIAAGIYGLIVWSRGVRRDNRKSELRITSTPRAVWVAAVGVYLLLHGAIYLFLTECTDSNVPFWDSLTTALCIVAYWLLSRKYIEQWLVWLAVDVVTVGLYIYKGIPITAGLYALYSTMAVAGYLRWRRVMKSYATES